MLNLPSGTSLKKIIPKKMIYTKFQLKQAERDEFDEAIRQISVIHELSPKTVNIPSGKNVAGIFVLQAQLKDKNCKDKLLIHLSKLIDRNMVLLLIHGDDGQLALLHNDSFLRGTWQNLANMQLNITGLDLDTVWENFVRQIGEIQVEEGNTLDEQLVENAEQELIMKEISALEKKMKGAKQPREKLELRQKLNELKKKLK